MGDVVQAAKWIDEGHIVKRADWLYEGPWDGVRKHDSKPYGHGLAGRVGFSLEDILATDWEIVEAAPKEGQSR